MTENITFALLLLVLGVPYVIIGVAMYLDAKYTKRFDERQLLLRGRSYRNGFFAMIVTGVLLLLTDMLDFGGFADADGKIFLILLSGILICLTDGALRGAFIDYRTRKNNAKTTAIVYAVLAIPCIAVIIGDILRGDYSKTPLTLGDLYFIGLMLAFISISAALWIRHKKDISEAQEEETN